MAGDQHSEGVAGDQQTSAPTMTAKDVMSRLCSWMRRCAASVDVACCWVPVEVTGIPLQLALVQNAYFVQSSCVLLLEMLAEKPHAAVKDGYVQASCPCCGSCEHTSSSATHLFELNMNPKCNTHPEQQCMSLVWLQHTQ